jgi:hypothetical protein
MRILQWLLALVFAVTAGLKLGSTSSGVMAQTMFGSLPHAAQRMLVGGELVMAVWLASNWRPRWSAFFTIVVLSTFLGALVVELGKPDPQPCGCLGALSTGSAMRGLWISVALDGIMLIGALFLYYWGKKPGIIGNNQFRSEPRGG